MPMQRLLVAFTVAALAFASIVVAERPEITVEQPTTGIYSKGVYFGFVPAHLKKAEKSNRPAATSDSLASDPKVDTATLGTHIAQPVAFQETTAEPLVESDIPSDGLHAFCEAVVPCRPVSCNDFSWWGRAEYLLWWTDGMDVPDLATSGDAADAQPAAIGQPGTGILFGNSALNDDSRSGGKFTLGTWLDPCRGYGVEFSYLALGSEDTAFRAGSNNVAVLGRPFFNIVQNTQDARLIANPGTVAGTLDIVASTDFDTLELNFRRTFARPSGTRLEFLLGYRTAELDDHLRMDEATQSLAGPTVGTTFELFDQFNTQNSFDGAQLGFVWQGREHACWSWEVVAKVALGQSRYRANVTGQTVTTDDLGNSATVDGGLLTQATNLGSYRWDEFATVTELGVTVRRELQCGVSAQVGYTFLYWSDVARAGDQIDTSINPTQIPPGVLTGEARPAFPFRTNDFSAQGLRFALEYNY